MEFVKHISRDIITIRRLVNVKNSFLVDVMAMQIDLIRRTIVMLIVFIKPPINAQVNQKNRIQANRLENIILNFFFCLA